MRTIAQNVLDGRAVGDDRDPHRAVAARRAPSAGGAGLMPSPATDVGLADLGDLAAAGDDEHEQREQQQAPHRLGHRPRRSTVAAVHGMRAQARAAAGGLSISSVPSSADSAVLEPAQAGAGLDVGAADAVVLDEHDRRPRRRAAGRRARSSACAYLATLVSASATTK